MQDHPQKGNVFFRRWQQIIALSLSFLTDSYPILCSGSVLVTTGSMRWYLQPNQVLQEGTSIHTVAKRFAVSVSTVFRAWRRHQETGCYTRTQQQDICSFVWGGTGGALPDLYIVTSSTQLVCMFLTKLSETDSSNVQLDWHLPENTRIGRAATSTPFSSQMRAGPH